MKKIIFFLIVLCFLSSNAFAFLYEIKPLAKEEIVQLSDDQLVDKYIDAKIEVNASQAFHNRAGFTPKEYEQYKTLLKYIVELNKEMTKRKIEAPPVDQWIE